jgi:hypothetical protein
MASCFGFCSSNADDEQDPLLPLYSDDTSRQRALHQKLHSYQMIKAIRDGYMPSTEQLITNLRSLLASDILNPTDPNLSESGRKLTKYSKQWLQNFIGLLGNKNREDEIQDFLWYLSRSRVSVDIDDIARRAGKAKAKADAAAGQSRPLTTPWGIGRMRRSQYVLMFDLFSLPQPADRWLASAYQLRLPTLSL